MDIDLPDGVGPGMAPRFLVTFVSRALIGPIAWIVY